MAGMTYSGRDTTPPLEPSTTAGHTQGLAWRESNNRIFLISSHGYTIVVVAAAGWMLLRLDDDPPVGSGRGEADGDSEAGVGGVTELGCEKTMHASLWSRTSGLVSAASAAAMERYSRVWRPHRLNWAPRLPRRNSLGSTTKA